MDSAHLHLFMNHVPVIGSIFATALLLVALWRRSLELQRVALWGIVLVALSAVPVYFSGEEAEHVVEELGRSHDHIEEHEEFAKLALIAIGVLGAVALAGIFIYRRAQLIPRGYLFTLLLLSLGSTVMMGITANLGGQISHPEIRSGFTPSAEGNEAEEGEENGSDDSDGNSGRGRGRGRGGS